MTYEIKRKLFQPPVNQEEIGNLWKDRGFSCHLYVDKPGQEWNDFIHSTNELVTVIHGRLQLIVGKEEITLNVGDELFIPARERHSVKNIFDRETKWLFGYD
jgi:quercetin dioxygenase-like cupin family protein